jgi:hypothetical protein
LKYIAVGIILIVLVALGAAAVWNTLFEKRAATPVTFETIASYDFHDKVSIEGKIYLSSSVGCGECYCSNLGSTCCRLYLRPLTPNKQVPEVWLSIHQTYSQEPNHFYLNDFYDAKDFRIFTDDGPGLTVDTPIRVTGKWNGVGDFLGDPFVSLCVYKIEAIQ